MNSATEEQYVVRSVFRDAGRQPASADALCRDAVARAEGGKPKSALRLLESALRIDPNCLEALLLMGHVACELDDPARMETAFRKASLRHPDCADAFYGLGMALHASARYEEAADALRRSLDLNPDCGEAAESFGDTLLTLDRAEEAETWYNRAIELCPASMGAYFGKAVACGALDKHALASLCFREALARATDNPDDLKSLAAMLVAQSQTAQAAAFLLRAVELAPERLDLREDAESLLNDEQVQAEFNARVNLSNRPDDPEVYKRIGDALFVNGRRLEAASHYRRALEAPGTERTSVSYVLATALIGAGRAQEAVAVLEMLLESEALNARTCLLLGEAQRLCGRFEEALEAFRLAVALDEESPDALTNLGALLLERRRALEALPFLKKAVTLAPDRDSVYINVSAAHMMLGWYEAAEKCLRGAVERIPDNSQILNNFGATLMKLSRYEEAEEAFRKAIELDPSNPSYMSALGSALCQQGKALDGRERHLAALAALPEDVNTLINVAYSAVTVAEFDHAAEAARKAIALDPGNTDAHVNLGLALLSTGAWEQGWDEYERRLAKRKQCRSGVARWDGRPIPGKTLVVRWEQGFGDTLQFARFLPRAKEMSQARVLFECQEALAPLFTPDAGFDQLVTQAPEQFDYYIELASLPRLMGIRVDNIPAEPARITVEPELRESWARRMEERIDSRRQSQRFPADRTLRVGVVWGGNPLQGADRYRSCGLAAYAPLADIPGFSWFSLQKGDPANQLAHPPAGMDIFDLASEIRDFRDTAAALCNLDLLITVCTSVAHLAGSLGVPTWTLLAYSADWRWLLDRSDTPWYPSMRLFRQPEIGDWTSVFEKVRGELDGLLAQDGQRAA